MYHKDHLPEPIQKLIPDMFTINMGSSVGHIRHNWRRGLLTTGEESGCA